MYVSIYFFFSFFFASTSLGHCGTRCTCDRAPLLYWARALHPALHVEAEGPEPPLSTSCVFALCRLCNPVRCPKHVYGDIYIATQHTNVDLASMMDLKGVGEMDVISKMGLIRDSSAPPMLARQVQVF